MQHNAITPKKAADKTITFLVTLAIVIALNAILFNLPLRFDITKGSVNSLSKASKTLVKELAEPFTVMVFLSKNIPVEMTMQEQYVRDILREYRASGRNFRYEFVDVEKRPELVEQFNVPQMQVEVRKQDQVTKQNAYMSAVLMQGDRMEYVNDILRIPLEYAITAHMKKMTERVNKISALKTPVAFNLYASDSLASYADIDALMQAMEESASKLGKQYLGRVAFSKETSAPPQTIRRHQLEKGVDVYLGVSVTANEKTEYFDLLRRNFFGQVAVIEPEELQTALMQEIDDMLGVNKKVGFVTSVDLYDFQAYQSREVNPEAYSAIAQMTMETVQMETVSLSEPIPSDISALLFIDPREALSDEALYRLDQFIMSGKPVGFALTGLDFPDDTRKQSPYGPTPPFGARVETGLEDILYHYGIIANKDVVNDKDALTVPRRQTTPEQSPEEEIYYFAPRVRQENIARKDPITEALYELIVIMSSSLSPVEETIRERGLTYTPLVRSSKNAWQTEEGGALAMSQSVYPPLEEELRQFDLVVKLTGNLQSYFADKKRPALPEREEKDFVTVSDAAYRSNAQNATLYVLGTPILLQNQIFMMQQQNNYVFAQNVIDALAMDSDLLGIRNKMARNVPLRVTDIALRYAIAGANVFGLPIIFIVIGLILWRRDRARRKRLREEFSEHAY